jgi:hypothetical protein
MHTSLLLQCNYKLTVLNRIITILTLITIISYIMTYYISLYFFNSLNQKEDNPKLSVLILAQLRTSRVSGVAAGPFFEISKIW